VTLNGHFTLNSVFAQVRLECLYGLLENNCVKIITVDSHCQQQKCSAWTLVSGDIRFMQIFAKIPWEGGIKRQGVVENGNFWRYYCYFLQFSANPKFMTLNDLEWLHPVKFCFCADLVGSDRATFEK